MAHMSSPLNSTPGQISKPPSNRANRLLLVDDDASIRDAVSEYLSHHGYQVGTAEDVPSMQLALEHSHWDLIILDLMMPGEDGLSACRRLSDKCPPILILSAMSDVIDRVAGLEAGACDYLPKPFEPRELLARIRAMLRLKTRVDPAVMTGSVSPSSEKLFFGDWVLFCDDRLLTNPDGHPVALTQNEFQLLEVFARRPGRILSRDTIMDLTRGNMSDSFDRSVDLAISRLRAKLGPQASRYIETVRGLVYRFVRE